MSPGRKRLAQKGIAWLQQRQHHGLIGLCAGMRLDIGEFAAEKLLRPVDGDFLRHIDEFAPAIIAPAGIALGIFVGQYAALGFENRARDDILRCNQLDLRLLAQGFRVDRLGNRRIGLVQRRQKKITFQVALVCCENRKRGGLSHGSIPVKMNMKRY